MASPCIEQPQRSIPKFLLSLPYSSVNCLCCHFPKTGVWAQLCLACQPPPAPFPAVRAVWHGTKRDQTHQDPRRLPAFPLASLLFSTYGPQHTCEIPQSKHERWGVTKEYLNTFKKNERLSKQHFFGCQVPVSILVLEFPLKPREDSAAKEMSHSQSWRMIFWS